MRVNCSDAAQGGLITTWPLPEGFGGASGRPEDPAAATRVELQGMRQSALRKRAKAAGATEDDLDVADDEDNTKGALVELILRLLL